MSEDQCSQERQALANALRFLELVHASENPDLNLIRAAAGRLTRTREALEKCLHPDPISTFGEFIPTRDAFQFKNHFNITADQVIQFQEILPGVLLDLVGLRVVNEIKNALSDICVSVPVPIFDDPEICLLDVIPFGSVAEKVHSFLFESVERATLEALLDPNDTNYGRCGGMAFAGYDFFLQQWPVAGFGKTTPQTGALSDYIYKRLIDSLKLNMNTFVTWWAKVVVLPKVGPVASAAALTLLGAVAGGFIGAALGAAIGTQIDLGDFGGPKSVLGPTKQELPKIAAKLQEQSAWPIGLIFGNKTKLWDQHQVLATKLSSLGNQKVELEIWDNNDGNKANTLTINYSGDHLEVSALPDTNITRGNKQIVGIFLEEYVPQKPPLSLKLA